MLYSPHFSSWPCLRTSGHALAARIDPCVCCSAMPSGGTVAAGTTAAPCRSRSRRMAMLRPTAAVPPWIACAARLTGACPPTYTRALHRHATQVPGPASGPPSSPAMMGLSRSSRGAAAARTLVCVCTAAEPMLGQMTSSSCHQHVWHLHPAMQQRTCSKATAALLQRVYRRHLQLSCSDARGTGKMAAALVASGSCPALVHLGQCHS